jgi:VWFA-related protein
MVAAIKHKSSRKRPHGAAGLVQLAAMAIVVLGQSPFPATSCAATQEPNPAQAKDGGGQATLKTTVRQVLLDVVVTDGKNHPITGLRQEDFLVLEDGEPQKIVFFEPHTSSSDASLAEVSEAPMLPPNTFVNTSAATDKLPLNVLLYDLVNTAIDDQPFAHNEIVKFLKNRPAGGRFAIFVLTDTLHLVQGFTDDGQQLVAAMNRKEAGPRSTASYQGSVPDASRQLSRTALFAANDAGQEMLGRLEHMEAFSRNYFLNRRVGQTIAAFQEIAKFLSGLPGRKNLIWLSGSFPANIFPGGDPLDPFGSAVNYGTELRQTADLLTVGQVAVYPVDIRGLTVDPVYNASNPATYRSPEDFLRAHLNFMLEIAAEQATMDQVADDTGGHAFYNTNGLADAIAMSTEDGSNYYTLSYSPSNTKFDGKMRKIRVRLAQKGYHLAYRHSYLADDSVVEQKRANAPIERLQVALRRGSPLMHELVFEARVTIQGRPRAPNKAEIAQLVLYPAFAGRKKWDGVQIERYLIDYLFPAPGFSLETSPDGKLRGSLEFLFGAYDADDRTMFGARTPDNRTYTPKSIEEIQKGGYRVHQVIEIPSGAASLRLAVRDAVGDRLGSLEIPLPLAPERVNAKQL